MCNFNLLDDAFKDTIATILQAAAQRLGGANPLLTLIESVRAKKPTPLTQIKCALESKGVLLTWNKSVFLEKYKVLDSIIVEHRGCENPYFNLLEHKNPKRQKDIFNMVKTLKPLEFSVKSTTLKESEALSFTIFDAKDEATLYLNPLFVAIFFCSPEFAKKALNHKPNLTAQP